MGLLVKMLNVMLAAMVALALPASPQKRAGDFRWQKTLGHDQTLEIKGVNGEVSASPAGGGAVEVVASKHGRRSDPADVEIEVVEHAGGVTICAVYPSAGNRPNECRPGEGGRMDTRNNDVSVDFEVRIPAGVRFVGRTVNGSVEAEGLAADADGYTVNGGVRIGTSGVARAETVNGGIRAAMGRADWSGPLSFKTVNGSIRLELPASTSADVKAETVNGDITTDFPLTVKGRFGRRMSGTIGAGGRSLDLETVNGSIELRQGR